MNPAKGKHQAPTRRQWRGQNVEKKYAYQMETTGSSSDSLMNCFPYQMGTALKGKNWLPEGANSFLSEQVHIVWKITFYHIR